MMTLKMKSVARLALVLLASMVAEKAGASPAAPAFKRIMLVVFENADAKKVLAQPTFKRIAAEGAYLTNLKAQVHPSQGNYIALVSGSLHGTKGDGSKDIDAHHLGDLLEGAGRTWKSYLEGYPGDCFTGSRSGDYVRKHNPFISFLNVQNDKTRCNAHLVNSSVLAADIAAGTLPDFSLYIPDLKNDGHDTGVKYADAWLAREFAPLFKDPRFMKDMLVILTFDESGYFGGNKIYGAFYGDSVRAGTQATANYTHYSLLRTIEESLVIGSLGLGDAAASPVTGIWK